MTKEFSTAQDSAPNQAHGFDQALGVLRQFRGARRLSSRAVEHCELCSAELQTEHPHLIELVSRQIACSCDPCALLFDGKEHSKFKRVSRRVLSLPDFTITDEQWDSLIIPINLAFFFRASIEGRMIALYPSPAGAVESLLTLDAWQAIVDANPVLQALQPDIEALLVNRIDPRRNGHSDSQHGPEYFIAPIDECYKLVGLIRAHWKGLSGGTEVWSHVDSFFAELRAKSEPAGRGTYA
jgi:hypothetical protein